MAYKRPVRTSVYVKAYPTVRKRIEIPQPIVRPLAIPSRDLMKKEALKGDAWWYTQHRRGIRRPKVGEDPLEMRAVSKEKIYGTLPERIVYKYLTDRLRFVPNVDFDFQSSQSGGRLELGGLVADFLFYFMKIVIQVQGPTHAIYLRAKKDEEQRMILVDMGYRVFDIDEPNIYNEARLSNWMRRTFGMAFGLGSGDIWFASPGASTSGTAFGETEMENASFEEEYEDPDGLQALSDAISDLASTLG